MGWVPTRHQNNQLERAKLCQMDRALAELARAERSEDAAALQKAYEALFLLCYENDLDLPAVLHETEA
jgi:hypothetical protein